MPDYSFKARNKAGTIETGVVNANSEKAALVILKERGLYVSSINKKRFDIRKAFSVLQLLGSKISSRDLAIWANQFHAMYTAGVPVAYIITTLAQQTENKGFKEVQQEILTDVKQGVQVGRAMTKHPGYFPELMVNMFQVGEEAGVMDDALDQIVSFYNQEHEMKQKMKTAMYYPVVIVVMSFAVIWLLMTQMVPAFVQAYSELGSDLPLPTKVLIQVSNFLIDYGWFVILFIIVFIIGVLFWKRTARGRMFFDWVGYKLPVLGELKKLNSLARFCRIFATLQSRGIDIITSLNLIQRSISSPIMGKAIDNAKDNVIRGRAMAQAFREDKYYPPLVVNMLAVGEESGTVDVMMEKAANLYEVDVKNMSERLDKLLEPVINLGLAIVVGGILLAVIVPMFSMYNLVGY